MSEDFYFFRMEKEQLLFHKEHFRDTQQDTAQSIQLRLETWRTVEHP